MSIYAIYAILVSQLARAAWAHDKATTVLIICGLTVLFIQRSYLDARAEERRARR